MLSRDAGGGRDLRRELHRDGCAFIKAEGQRAFQHHESNVVVDRPRTLIPQAETVTGDQEQSVYGTRN